MVPKTGIEPVTRNFSGCRSTHWATPAIIGGSYGNRTRYTFPWTTRKTGGSRGSWTLLVSNLARITRSPLLPPYKNLRITPPDPACTGLDLHLANRPFIGRIWTINLSLTRRLNTLLSQGFVLIGTHGRIRTDTVRCLKPLSPTYCTTWA